MIDKQMRSPKWLGRKSVEVSRPVEPIAKVAAQPLSIPAYAVPPTGMHSVHTGL